MPQLYLLSVILNGLTGFLFVFGETEESDSVEKNVKVSIFDNRFRLVLGILTVVTGFLKLFLPYEGIPILGDFVPALAGIAGGFILLFGFYKEHAENSSRESNLDRVGNTVLRYKKIVGFSLIAVSLLHFFFPAALFL